MKRIVAIVAGSWLLLVWAVAATAWYAAKGVGAATTILLTLTVVATLTNAVSMTAAFGIFLEREGKTKRVVT